LHIDELARKLTMDAGRLSAILLQLELNGIVLQQPGKLFLTAGDSDR
jgi:DNA processing protein